jgi:hypothetical protein
MGYMVMFMSMSIWKEKLMYFLYAEKQKPLYMDESTTRRRRTITAGSSIDHDIDTQSVYGFETPLPERRVTGKLMASLKLLQKNRQHQNDSLV